MVCTLAKKLLVSTDFQSLRLGAELISFENVKKNRQSPSIFSMIVKPTEGPNKDLIDAYIKMVEEKQQKDETDKEDSQ